MSIIPSKNNFGGILILWNSVFDGIPQNFMEFGSLIPAESKYSVKFLRNSVVQNSVVRNSAGHSSSDVPSLDHCAQ